MTLDAKAFAPILYIALILQQEGLDNIYHVDELERDLPGPPAPTRSKVFERLGLHVSGLSVCLADDLGSI